LGLQFGNGATISFQGEEKKFFNAGTPRKSKKVKQEKNIKTKAAGSDTSNIINLVEDKKDTLDII
jgi:hypothetical protein